MPHFLMMWIASLVGKALASWVCTLLVTLSQRLANRYFKRLWRGQQETARQRISQRGYFSTIYETQAVSDNANVNKTISEYLARIGRKGGKATSPAKQKASRENGRLGGRPRKRKGEQQ